MEQKRVAIADLKNIITEEVSMRTWLKKLG
jgi:hypothetical protein